MEVLPPKRKRIKPVSVEEIEYLMENYDPETIKLMKINEEEFDIPEADKLEGIKEMKLE